MADTNLSLDALLLAQQQARIRTSMAGGKTGREMAAEVSRFEQRNAADRAKKAAEQPQDAFGQALAAIANVLPGVAMMPEASRNAVMQGAVDGGTLGMSSPVIAGATSMMTGQPYSTALQERQDAARNMKAGAPYTSLATEVATSLVPSELIGRGAAKLSGKLLGDVADKPVSKFLTQGSAASAQGAGYSAGTGEGDPWSSGILAGLLGGAGGIFAPMSKAAKEESMGRQSADLLFGSETNAALGRGPGTGAPNLTTGELQNARSVLGPDATIADLNPILSAKVGSTITQDTLSSAAPLRAVTLERDIPAMLGQEIDAAVGSAFGSVAGKEARDAAFAQAGQAYEAAKSTMRSDGFAVDADFLRTQLQAAFIRDGIKPTSSFASARDKMLSELDLMTGKVPAKYDSKGKLISTGKAGKPELSVDEALALKKEFDMLISQTAPDKSVPKEVRAAVIEAKNTLNDQLRAHPEFDKAATMFSDEIDVINAEEFAKQVFSSNTSAADLAKMYAKMSDMEKAAVGRGARDVMQAKFLDKPGGEASLTKRLSSSRVDKATLDKMETVFGPDVVDKLQLAADKAAAYTKTASNVESGVVSASKAEARGVGSTDGIGNAADTATIVSQGAQNRWSGGALAGAARRQFVERQKAQWADVQRKTLEMAGATGSAADANIEALMGYLANAGKALPASGAGAAAGMPAAVTYGAFSGPQ